jgi:hypothetical protein
MQLFKVLTVPPNPCHCENGKLHGIKPLAGRTRQAVDGSVINAA